MTDRYRGYIALGEALEANAEAFTLADLSTVWIDVSVYQKHLLAVRQGQEVVISAGAGMPDATGTIAYIGPIVGEQTRTAMARVVLPNSDGLWRPGLFVTVGVAVEQLTVPVVVPNTAIQIVNGETVVFVEEAGVFKPVHVQVGRADSVRAEMVSGLDSGLSYVAKGGFHLKAELGKESLQRAATATKARKGISAMIERLVEYSLKNRLLLIVVVAVLVMSAGYYSYVNLPVDAFRTCHPAMQVFTVTEGLAEEIEKFVTYPVEASMNGLPGVSKVRSVSNFGLSVVNIYFEDGMDIYLAPTRKRAFAGRRVSKYEEFGEPESGPIATEWA